MSLFVLKSWFTLFLVDMTLRWRGFKTLHGMVQTHKVKQRANGRHFPNATLCHAMDFACVFYYRQVSPLERSVAATLLLRRYGWAADLVLGVQVFPYESYAWVEVEGAIVNDQPNLLEIYQVLERC